MTTKKSQCVTVSRLSRLWPLNNLALKRSYRREKTRPMSCGWKKQALIQREQNEARVAETGRGMGACWDFLSSGPQDTGRRMPRVPSWGGGGRSLGADSAP